MARLLAVADRSLADAEVTAVNTDARVGFAHAATIAVAAAALAAEGYRAGKERHHERLLDSLRYASAHFSACIDRVAAFEVLPQR